MILTEEAPTYVDGWQYDPDRHLWVQMTTTGSTRVPVIIWHWLPINDGTELDPGNQILVDEVLVECDGHGGGEAHLVKPATLPAMAIGKMHSGTSTELDDAQLTGAISLASYNLGWDISAALTEEQQSGVDHYWAAVYGAAGEGSRAGALVIDKITVSYVEP